eukprot:gene36104-44526_t
MRARFGVVQVLERMGSDTSLHAAVAHMLDQLRLCRGDNMGLRDVIPGIMMRIGQEQQCYDFIKWWLTGAGSDYDWGDMDLPYLSVKNADLFEPVLSQFHDKYGPSVQYVAAMTLIKFRVLIQNMTSQVTELLDAGDRYNKRLWPALIYPDPILQAPRASSYSHNSAEEVQLAIENVRPSWVSTP